MFNKEQFVDDLTKLRHEMALTRKIVAQEANVHPSTLQGIENNTYSPQIETFLKLCKWMKVEPSKYFKK